MFEKTYRSGQTGKNTEPGWNPESDLPPEDYLGDDFGGESEVIEDSYEGPEAATLSLSEVQRYVRSALEEAKIRKDETAVATLEGLLGRANRAAALSPASQRAELNTILDEVNSSSRPSSVETDLEGAEPEASETQTLQKDIDELQSKLKDLNDNTERGDIEEFLQDAKKALKSADLEKAHEAYDDAETKFDEVKGEQTSDLKDDEGKLKALKKEIEDSSVADPKKEELLHQLKAIEDQTKTLSSEELEDKVKDLKKAFDTEKKRLELTEKFTGFSSKIPEFGDKTLTQDLAGKISQAIQSGNWETVVSKLNPNAEGVNKDNLYHAVRQIVGTLYYTLAKEDEKQMELLLDLFPKEVRQAMVSCMVGFESNNHYATNESEKKARNLYGTGQQTKDRLEESLNKDDFASLPSSAPKP